MTEVSEPVVAVVVAAGSGVRLGGEVPKALREVGGRPLVARSVAALAAGGVTHAVVVIADGLAEAFARALAEAPIPVRYALGGRQRQDSVANGLAVLAADPDLQGCRIVLVHDAARALVPPEVVRRVIAAVAGGAHAVIPVIPVVDSVRVVTDHGSTVVDRAGLRAVQTPQGFDRQTLIRAHRLVATAGLRVTDDAAAAEALGETVALVEGSRRSLKITDPIDLVAAEALVREDP